MIAQAKRIDIALFGGLLEHFRDRHWLEERPTHLFGDLNFRRSDKRYSCGVRASGTNTRTRESDLRATANCLSVAKQPFPRCEVGLWHPGTVIKRSECKRSSYAAS